MEAEVLACTGLAIGADVMELQQIGIGHPAVKQVLAVRNNTAPNRYRLFVAEGLWANNVILEAELVVDTFFWCPEAIYSDETKKRSEELARRAHRAYRVSEKTLARLAEPWYGHDFTRVGVPMLGHADSLNVSVSASILLYEARARKDRW